MPIRPAPHSGIGQARPSSVEPRPRHVVHLTYETVEHGGLKSRHRWQPISPSFNGFASRDGRARPQFEPIAHGPHPPQRVDEMHRAAHLQESRRPRRAGGLDLRPDPESNPRQRFSWMAPTRVLRATLELKQFFMSGC